MAWDDEPPKQQELATKAGSWDSAPPTSQELSGGNNYWQDVKKNATQEAKAIPGGLLNTVNQAANMGITSPIQTAKTLFGAAKAGLQTGRDIVGAAASGPQVLMGTPLSETYAGQNFRQRPLAFAGNVASVAAPVAGRLFGGAGAAGAAADVGKAAEAGTATAEAPSMFKPIESPGTPNYLETKGGQGLNQLAGIKSSTVNKLTKAGQNPGVVGTNLGKQLADEGALGSTATETFAKASKVMQQHGQAVQQALQNIRQANQSLGSSPELGDPLKVQAVPVLKPIIDESNEILKSGYDDATGNMMKNMYQNLQNKANENNGFLTLNMVDDEMGHVGKMFNHAAKNSDKWQHASVLYGKLANIRDSMVNDIAEQTGNPKLSQDLKAANANYSRYARIMPDIRNAAAAESTGQMNLGGMMDELKKALFTGPTASRSIMRAGTTGRKIFGSPSEVPAATAPISPAPSGPVNPESLPVVQPGSKTGAPHALFSYKDQFGPGGTERNMYTMFGDTNHPVFQKKASTGAGGHGSTVTESDVNELGVPITGKEPPRQFNGGKTNFQELPKAQKLTKQEAISYLKKAGGNKDLARKMALDDGKTF